jgi:hypothetical protein
MENAVESRRGFHAIRRDAPNPSTRGFARVSAPDFKSVALPSRQRHLGFAALAAKGVALRVDPRRDGRSGSGHPNPARATD